jgi:hypothetical protein
MALALAAVLASGCVAVGVERTEVSARAAAVATGIERVQLAFWEGPGELAPEVIDVLGDGDVVHLDLLVPPDAVAVRSVGAQGYGGNLTECGYGPVENVGEVSVRTGSNHLLLVVRPGTPERHAANGVSCEYTPNVQADVAADPQDASVRVRGCYLASEVSIPTARMLVMNPLDAKACGLATG